MSAGTHGAQVPSVGWMLAMSSWLIVVFAGFGFTSWLGFLIIGVVARRVQWFVAAGVYLVAMIAAQLMPTLNWPVTVSMSIVWGASVLHAVLVNPGWLRYMWGRRMDGMATQYTSPPRVRDTTLESEPFSDDSVPHPDFLPAPPSVTAAGLVNPATATAEQLDSIPFMSRERAEYVVRYRSGRRLESLEDLIEFLGLQPHEAIAMRGRLLFERQPGAIQPPPSAQGPISHQPASGRILDV